MPLVATVCMATGSSHGAPTLARSKNMNKTTLCIDTESETAVNVSFEHGHLIRDKCFGANGRSDFYILIIFSSKFVPKRQDHRPGPVPCCNCYCYSYCSCLKRLLTMSVAFARAAASTASTATLSSAAAMGNGTMTRTSTVVGEEVSLDCPICLEALTESELTFVMPCHTCRYNFCSKCVSEFVRASKDDFQVASDGSRQVKIHIACPQCRSKYPMEISKVMLLRQVHSLGAAICDQEGQTLDDSSLTATQLSVRRDLVTPSKRRQVELSHGLYRKVMTGLLDLDKLAQAESQCQRVFKGMPEPSPTSGGDGATTFDEEDYNDDEYSDKPASPKRWSIRVDNSLFQGLQDLMGRDEKMFLTDLLTSGEVSKLAQAAMILNGVLELTMQPPSMRPLRSFETQDNSKSYKREANLLEQTKKRFPLTNHMPGYFILPTFSKHQMYLSFVDTKWDGTIVPTNRSNRVFEQVYGGHYKPLNADQPRSVVQIQAVRGPAGRVGLRKFDTVTHINELEWTGTATELANHIYELYQNQPEETISITVNANPETAMFLKVRRELMELSKLEG